MAPPPLELDVIDADRRLAPPTLTWLVDHLRAALTLLGVHGEVRVRVVGDVEMAAAHERFAGVPGTTDVLTFDHRDPPANADTPPLYPYTHQTRQVAIDLDQGKIKIRNVSVLDTDILICFDVADRESRVLGTSIERELLLYTIHGVLHCIGFDDHEESAAGLMHRVEDAVLVSIGVGPVFHPRGK